MVKKRGLGRGLDVLLGQTKLAPEEVTSLTRSQSKESIKELPIEFLKPGKYQPRRNFDEDQLKTLAESIAKQGLIQPIVVRKVSSNSKGNDRYEILAGERRWRASQLAQLKTVPVVIKEMTDQVALAVSLIENIQREDLSPIEEAEAIERFVSEFNLTHSEIAEIVGRSRSAVSNSLRLLELCEGVKQLLLEKKIDMGHARALIGLSDTDQINIASQIIDKGLTVREVESLVKAKNGKSVFKKKVMREDPDIKRLSLDLSEALGMKVTFKSKTKEKGVMTISYDSLDQLEGVLAKLK